MGVCSALSNADERRCTPAPARSTASVQRLALDGAERFKLALLASAQRAPDLPRWDVVYQQTQRWIKAGCFEAMVHDLRLALRVFNKRRPAPSAAILDSRTVSSTPESGQRAGYNGHKKTNGSKVHVAVDIRPKGTRVICSRSKSHRLMKMTAHRLKP